MVFLVDGVLLALAVVLHLALGRAARGARGEAGAGEHEKRAAGGLPASDEELGLPPREIAEPGLPRLAAWGAGVLALGPGSLLAFAPWLMAVDQRLVCGAGDVMIEVGCGDGGGCLECQAHPDSGVLVHYLGAMTLAMSIVVLLGLTIIALRRYRARASRAAAA